MKRRIDFETILQLATLATMLLSLSVSVMGQQQPPTVTRPSASSVQVTPRGTASPLGSATNATTGMKPAVGAITGFVYWQMNVLQPSSTCQGLTVKVVTVSKVGMPLQLLSTTNTLTAAGPMTDTSSPGTPKYMLCSYAFQNMPENVALRVLLYGAPSSASVSMPSSFQIPGGNCNSTPSSSLSFILTGGEMLCGNGAFNVNFKVTSAAVAARPTTPSILLPHTPGPSGMLSQPQAAPANATPGAPNTGGATLLSANPSSAPGNASNTPASNGMLAPTVKSGGAASISGSGGFTGGVKPGTAPPRNPLTNADVIKMVKAGVPETAIVSSIQSSPTKFDLSPNAQLTLHRAGVSQKVLDTMMADGGAKRGIASRTTKLGPAKTGEIVKNPRAAQADTAIITVLEKQKQSAQLEASQMVRTAGRPVGMQAGPSQPMSATTSNNATAPTAATIQRSSTPGTVSPGKGSDSPGNSVASFAPVPQVQTTALTCATEPAMRILNVSGEFYPATFTPDAKYNFYTITGCSFGDSGPNSKVYIYYQDIFRQDFQIQEWNDNGIKLNLNPSLKGVLDQDNLTLVVQRNDGKQATKVGFKFYAAREMTMLGRIPREAFSLNHFTLTNTTDLQVTYTSPSSPDVIPGVSGYTTEVSWECTDCSANPDHPNFAHWAPSGEDIYQFKNLQPGFVATQAAMASVDASCKGTLHREGNFNLNWVGDDLHATWQGQTCQWSGCGGFGQPDCFGQGPGSNYAVNVWVTGPRGVDPWTGKPN